MRFQRAEAPVADGLRAEDMSPTGVAVDEGDREAVLKPTEEQTRYAGVLETGTRLGLFCLFITFSLYVFGVVQPHTPVEDVTRCWSLDVGSYRSELETEAGWAWASMLGRGDFMNFIGIAVLGSVTGVCFCAMIPMMVKRRDWVYAVLAALQIVIFIVAASGIIRTGH